MRLLVSTLLLTRVGNCNQGFFSSLDTTPNNSFTVSLPFCDEMTMPLHKYVDYKINAAKYRQDDFYLTLSVFNNFESVAPGAE